MAEVSVYGSATLCRRCVASSPAREPRWASRVVTRFICYVQPDCHMAGLSIQLGPPPLKNLVLKITTYIKSPWYRGWHN